AQMGEVPSAVWLLFVANCLWTVAYDTQYAMVDREYDLQIGVESTAVLFGDADTVIIGILQGMFLLAMVLAGRQFELGRRFYLGLVTALVLFIHQQRLLRHREPDGCCQASLNNHWLGAAIFAGVLLHYLLPA